jgi:long-chain acyl-CoA synthetase
MIDFMIDVMQRNSAMQAIAEPTGVFRYADILKQIDLLKSEFQDVGVKPGSVVSLEGEYGFHTISAFIALTSVGAILVPLSADSKAHAEEFRATAMVEHRVCCSERIQVTETEMRAHHPFFEMLRAEKAPGLVLFSSGSTGKNKAAVHNLAKLLNKFRTSRNAWRTLVFLQLDHIGGVNTMLYTLSNAGCIVVAPGRSADEVANTIQKHRVELLPTSPTFLNLLLLSGAASRYDLSSLKLITYGTEAMPESTLERAVKAFPDARFQQTYGLTEVGILRSKSREDGSLWVRVGGDGYETKIVNDRLWIKAESAMLGYLNAPSPFDADGYFDTGDRVEVDGEWLRILGRDSEIINVGGQKVYPAEVESVLLQMDNVVDAMVKSKANPITGQIVHGSVRLNHAENQDQFKARMRIFCRDRLAPYKIPSQISIVDTALYSERFKRIRRDVQNLSQ